MLRRLRLFRNETTESDATALLSENEAQNEITPSVDFQTFSLSELELTHEMTNLAETNLQNYESVKIIDCPSFESTLNSITLKSGIFIKLQHILCLHFIINDFIRELTDIEFYNFFNGVKLFSSSFIVIFECKEDNSCLVFWRLKESFQIFSLVSDKNSTNFSEFLKKFLVVCIKNDHNGLHPQCQNYPKNRIQVTTYPYYLADSRSFDLLILAAQAGKLDLVDFLLDTFDMNYTVNGKTSIDFAYESNHFDVVCFLLKENSKYPRNFELSSSMTDELKDFVNMSKNIHEAIEVQDAAGVEEILYKYPVLKYFYDVKNRSALRMALTSGNFEIYKLLVSKNAILGPHEIFEDLIKELSEDQRSELAEINESMFQNIGEKHILMLMSNTQVGPDDKKTRLSIVCDAFQKLNTVPGIKILLQIVAATRNFQFIFDFNREHITFLEPSMEGYSTGLFSVCGRIYIGAKHLLDASRAHEVLGVMAHEICHFVMFKVFDNSAKPYTVKDEEVSTKFNQILETCKQTSHVEEIVNSVFLHYDSEQQPAELIVRIPHALGLYIDNKEKYEEFRENFLDLSDFYDEIVPVMQQKLPEIEKEVEDQIRKEHSSPINFIKYHWKKILAALFSIALTSLLTTFTARSCLFLSCGDSRSFCEFDLQHFGAICKCYGDLYWDKNLCNQCLRDNHCLANHSCYENSCLYNKNIFDCKDRSQRFLSNRRCDGIEDCADGSDEKYHCVSGIIKKLIKGGVTLFIEDLIDSDDYLIYQNILYKYLERLSSVGPEFSHFPVNISRSMPYLRKIALYQTGVKRLPLESLWGLHNLETLYLTYNQISSLEDGLQDLKALKFLSLAFNTISVVDRNVFDNLTNLEELDLTGNFLTTFDDRTFDNLQNLKVLRFDVNRVNFLGGTVFRRLHNLTTLSFLLNPIDLINPALFDNLHNFKELELSSMTLKNLKFTLFKNCSSVESILITGNYSRTFKILSEYTFTGCVNLESLSLSENCIEILPTHLLRDLINLKRISLHCNALGISEIPEQIFENTTKLEIIDFSSNMIQSLPPKLFRNLNNLKEVNMTHNELIHLSSSLFQGNLKMRSIIFRHNKIETIDEDLIDNLQELSILDLQNNVCINSKYGDDQNITLTPTERKGIKSLIKITCGIETSTTPRIDDTE